MDIRKLLIVEDTITELSRYKALAESHWEVETASTIEETKKILEAKSVDALLTDIHLTKSIEQDSYEGYDIIHHARKHHPEVLVLAMSSDPKIETYQQVYALGAKHFVKKPIVSCEELKIALEIAKHNHLLVRSKGALESELPQTLKERCQDGLVLSEKLRKRINGLAKRRDIVSIIYGESGTGKEEIAKLIHRIRMEADGHIPFVAVNCANLDSATAASRLFGHKKGSFTGADQTTVGYVGEANGGILFLDEIHWLNQDCQARLLRVLNDGSYERFGDVKTLRSSFQVIVASTKNLDVLVQEGKFMIDLRSRLTGMDIELKPLRERQDEIDLFVTLFFAREHMVIPAEEHRRLVKKCQSYYWQGNVRQLFNVLKSLVVSCQMDEVEITADQLPEFLTMMPPRNHQSRHDFDEPFDVLKPLTNDLDLKESINNYERLVIQQAISRHNRVQDVCAALNISRTNLDVKRKKYALR